MFIIDAEQEMTKELLEEFIKEHKALVAKKYKKLERMYMGDHNILHEDEKPQYKPDNRLVVNFANYIVNTFNGYFIGVPVKVEHESESVMEYINFLDSYNNQDDNNAELAKLCSIYGNAFELVFSDENGQIGTTFLSPTEAFIIYDDSLLKRPKYGVRYYTNKDGELEGSYSDDNNIYYFNEDFEVVEETPNLFRGVPLIEYKENEEKIGAFEQVESLINAYNKALSEKANDVEYYADAYLKILGADLDEETLKTLRSTRIINMSGEISEKAVVDFLAKPSADGTQENLIDRLEKLIFQQAMVANINDDNFGNASGISLAYKLQAMDNLAKVKERKFQSSINRRMKLISQFPGSKLGEDDWTGFSYTFTRNVPKNLKEETEIAKGLAGITSEETQLAVLSIVDDVKRELDRKEKEQEQIIGEDNYGMVLEE